MSDRGGDAPRPGESGDARPSDGVEPDGERVAGWPVELAGVVETIAATRGPNGRWNHAALGIERADTGSGGWPAGDRESDDALATATTWGRTRTRRNLVERGEAYLQFTRDPVDFVAAALDVHETNAPILERADAWVRVEAEERDRGEAAGTERVEWTMAPEAAAIRSRVVPTTNRGRAAVVEATVAASRLDVDAYDERALLDRLEHLRDVVDRCGSDRDRAAFDRIGELTGWRGR